MPRLFSRTSQNFHRVMRGRRYAMEATGCADLPFWHRLWYRNLMWIWSFVKSETRRHYDGARHSITTIYCRTADRILGGSRHEQYILELDRRLFVKQELAKEAKRNVEKKLAKLFEFNLHDAERTNQHFTAPPNKTVH